MTALGPAPLALSTPSDPAEREADRLSSHLSTLTTEGVGVDGQSAGSFSTDGQALPRNWAAKLGEQLGHDLDGVRIHVDDAATSLARTLGARAVTRQNHIYFDRSEYQPGSHQGRQLLAHELIHVVQQHGGSTAAGFDYDVAIRFEIPGSIAHSPISTWTVEGGRVTHVRGWPPTTGAPAAGFRG